MDKSNFLNKMKKLDIALLTYWVFFIIFYIYTIVTNQISTPLYFDIVVIITNIVIFSIIIKSIKNKADMISYYENVVRLIYDEQYEKLEEMNGNEFYDLTSFLVKELNKSDEELSKILRLVRSISREEKNISIHTKNKDTKYIISFIQNIDKELKNTQKINTEFFKNIKIGKYNKIEVDSENVVEQQLNKVLYSMYIMNTNLKNVQSAIFTGEYKVEIFTEGVIGDSINIVNKVNTLLKSSEKSRDNLNEAINLFETTEFLEYIQPAFKGNLVRNFKNLENLYNNISESIKSIAIALENDDKVDVNLVGELFKPITNIINGIEIDEKNNLLENNTSESIETKSTDEMIDIVKTKIIEENKNSNKYETVGDYHTLSSNLILGIENELKNLKNVMANNDNDIYENDDKRIETIDIDEFEQVVAEVDTKQNVFKNDIFDVETEKVIKNLVGNIEIKNFAFIENIKKETEKIIKKTLNNKKQTEKNISNTVDVKFKVEKIIKKTNENKIDTENNVQKILDNKFDNKKYNTSRGDRVQKSKKEKKPLTYQDMLKEKNKYSYNPTKKTATHDTQSRETTFTQNPKQPITYQRYLESGKGKVGVKSNNVGNKSLKKSVKNKKFREGLSREEKSELELYGEILDPKTRKDIAIITNENDLGGF